MHTLINLKTLGNSPQSPIMEIAAASFDLTGKVFDQLSTTIRPDFNITPPDFDALRQIMTHRHRERVFSGVMTTPEVLTQLNNFMRNKESNTLWCNNHAIPAILTSTYTIYRISSPIDFHKMNNKAAIELATSSARPEYPQTANCFDECMYDVGHIVRMLGELTGLTPKSKVLNYEDPGEQQLGDPDRDLPAFLDKNNQDGG